MVVPPGLAARRTNTGVEKSFPNARKVRRMKVFSSDSRVTSCVVYEREPKRLPVRIRDYRCYAVLALAGHT